MTVANFFGGLIKTTNGWVRNAVGWYAGFYPGNPTVPPYNDTETADYCRITSYTPLSGNLNAYEDGSNIYNLNSPLTIALGGQFVGKWGEIYTNHTTTETTMLTFNNGNYLTCKYISEWVMEIGFYDRNNNKICVQGIPYPWTRPQYCALSLMQGENGLIFPALITYTLPPSGNPQFLILTSGSNATQYTFLSHIVDDAILDSDDPYATIPDPISTGGYGTFDYGDGDDIPAPTKPSISASDSGFVTLFNPSITELQDLADYMWSGLFDIGPWKKLMADPMDCIISLNIVPVLPSIGGTRELKVGNVGTGKTFSYIDEQFVEVNCGSITVNGKTASNLDYSPYVQASIYLPFIGERALDADDIMDSTITLSYIIDLFSGACTANIVCSKAKVKSRNTVYNKSRLLYSFNGNCACNIPYTNANYNNMLQSLVTAIGVGATAIATKGASLSGAAGIAQAGALVQSVTNEKPVINKSGNMGGTSGFMGQRTPYLIIKWPNQCRPKDVNKEIGQPSYLRGQLKNFHGFTRVHETFLSGLPCTEQERTEIDNLLKAGVILP